MDFKEIPKKVVVLGAAGKMGSGIVLLTAIEMTNVRITKKASEGTYVLYAADISSEGLDGLRKYIGKQAAKKAEKSIDFLKTTYADVITSSDNDLVTRYTEDILHTINFTTDLNSLENIDLIFEAVNENPELKKNLINKIKSKCQNPPIVFSNTSSIPIKELEESTDLKGRVVGFHFYNPPAVQRLIELITTPDTSSEIKIFAEHLAAKMKKVVVPSNDIAGFIGNGHFMRDLLYGLQQIEKLQTDYSFPVAAYFVDYVTRNLLVRPMGIFQLADYVGLDVCKNILAVMNSRIEDEELSNHLLTNLVEKGIRGGQYSDGSQKDGIFRYESGAISAVIDNNTGNYISVIDLTSKLDDLLGKLPSNIPNWKETIKSPGKDEELSKYFNELVASDSHGTKFAINYLRKSKEIGEHLVETGVTDKPENVNNVLLLGFYHAYGAINNYI